MSKYTCESCHTTGYRLTITAPNKLTEEALELLLDALCSYTDAPDTEEMLKMLNDNWYTEDLIQLELCKQVTIESESVHKEWYIQSLERISQ